MTTALFPKNIDTVIAHLYTQSDAPLPTLQRPIVSLFDLTRAYSLVCRELPGLTSHIASEFLLRRNGLVSPLKEANHIPLAGFLYATTDFGSIFVEKNDPVVRRRFSVAHEIGHYLLHFLPLLKASANGSGSVADWITDAFVGVDKEDEARATSNGHIAVTLSEGVPIPQTPFEQMEQEANEFAARLLMPADLVTSLATQYGVRYRNEELSWRLATEMLVSHAAMQWRLRHLNIFASLNADRN